MFSHFSRVRLFAILLTIAHQAPLSLGFSRQKYWSVLPHPPLGDLPDPGIEPESPALQMDSLPTEPHGEAQQRPKMLSDLGGSVVKNPPAKTGDTRDEGSIPGSGRCPGVGNGNPLQYSCLENPIDRGAWRATVHEVAELGTIEHTHTVL